MNLESIVKLGETALGGFAVGWLNDAYTQPALEGAFATLQTNHTMAKVIDTASLAGTALLTGEGLDLLGLRRVAEPVRAGGLIYAAFKGITILIPGAEAKLTTPSPLSLFRAAIATNPPAPAAQSQPGFSQVQGPMALLNSGQPSNAGQPSAALPSTSGFQLTPNGVFSSVPKPASTYLDAGI